MGSVEGGAMLQRYRRLVPFILAALLVLNLIQAVTDNTRGDWIGVSVMAVALAYTLWQRARTDRTDDPPR